MPRSAQQSKVQPLAAENINSDLVLQKLEQWKKHLLDLTRRNKLLYLSTGKAVVQITFPSIEQLIASLVIAEKQLSFPMPKKERQLLLQELRNSSESTDAPAPDEGFKPGDLETNVTVRELQRRLYRLRREWKTWQEEQGIHTLYIALGIVHWREAEHERDECLAPLILVPVGLVKEGTDKPYYLQPVDEEVVVNPALAFKLQRDFGIDLPEIPDELSGEAVQQFFGKLNEKVKLQGWSVQPEVWLGRFSFEKYVMYQDLESHRGNICDFPLVVALARAGELPQPLDVPGLDDPDGGIDAQEVFPVLDADSSQFEILLRARAGQNLVVHGPPGTGKSQTIVNLIAQALRDGKKVLFVSEKMAALDVVHKRLKDTGIAVGCLEVHSHHSDKGKVIEELGKALQQRLVSAIPRDAQDMFQRLVQRREFLNQYVKELHAARGALKLSAFQVHGKLARLMDAASIECSFPWTTVTDVNAVTLGEALDGIGRMTYVRHVFDRFKSFPWRDADIPLSDYSLQLRDKIISAISKLSEDVEELADLSQSLAEVTGLDVPNTLDEVEVFSELGKLLSSPQPGAVEWIGLGNVEISERLALSKEAAGKATELENHREELLRVFSEELLNLPVRELRDRYQQEYQTPARWFRRPYWQDRKAVLHYCRDKRPGFHIVRDNLVLAARIKDIEEWFVANNSTLRAKLGQNFRGIASTKWDEVSLALEWANLVTRLLKNGTVPDRLIAYVRSPVTFQPQVKRASIRLGEVLSFVSSERLMVEKVFPSGIAGVAIGQSELNGLRSWLDERNRPEDLDSWAAFLRAKQAADNANQGQFVNQALKQGVSAERLVPAFQRLFYKSLLAEIYRQIPCLIEFQGQRHEEIIREFCKLDSDLKKITATVICQTIQKRQPKRTESQSDSSQVGILLREMQKKRRHRPLRRLFSEIPHLLQQLKPCLLMSPLSVASYLAKDAFKFDLIIFDEASQIPPADAIGAVLRGGQLIVAGDDKQLPPTRFFQADADDYEDEDQQDTAPLESILDDCKAIPTFRYSALSWHYRSRHEELIAFSNRFFYRNELVTFPSPHPTGESGAVQFVHVPDGIYDRGGSRTNRVEAAKVADLISEHFEKHGNTYSLGVIALSLAQEDAILEELERRKLLRPEMAPLLAGRDDEPLFVKALEKVQGDERDYIILGIGYGRDSKGVVSHNFGPINKSGGERRLNVAVTRARFRTTVVCSILPHELDLARLTSGRDGVVRLQQYLDFAKNGGKFTEQVTAAATEELNDFEESVKTALESRGFHVDGQVGFSGFRIDLAIRHPEHQSRYILGVECDGATYHSHRTARDRDRLRQEVLVNLGWRIHRVWSTDWVKNPVGIVDSIVATVTALSATSFSGVDALPGQRLAAPGRDGEATALETMDGTTDQVSLDSASRIRTPELPVYRSFKGRSRPSSWLYEADSRPGRMNTLVEDVETIVQSEGPIHRRVVCRRICDIYCFEKTGNRIEEIVREAIRISVREDRVVRKGEFLWLSGKHKAKARVPEDGESVREVEEVAIEELAAAMEWVLARDYGLAPDQLVKEAANLMGYKATSQVTSRFQESLNWLFDQGYVKHYKDQVVLSQKT